MSLVHPEELYHTDTKNPRVRKKGTCKAEIDTDLVKGKQDELPPIKNEIQLNHAQQAFLNPNLLH